MRYYVLIVLVQVSGGAGSAYALKLVKDSGVPFRAVFADVKGTGYSHFWSDMPEVEYLLHERFGGESRDTYRLLWRLAYALDCSIERLEDGRSTWAVAAEYHVFQLVFNEKRRFCKASDILKRELTAQWIESQYTPGEYKIALGMDILEPHRIIAAQHYWRNRLGWDVEVYSPLIEHYQKTSQIIDTCMIQSWLIEIGIDIPEAYLDGLPHNNCNELCFMAGQSQYKIVYEKHRERYLYAAWQEYRLNRAGLVKATILKIGHRGVSLIDFIKIIEAGDVNARDIGACGCMSYHPAFMSVIAQAPTKKALKAAKSLKSTEVGDL